MIDRDAKNMAKSVQSVLVGIAQFFGGESLESAEEWVKGLRQSGRYQEDVWA